MSGLEVAATSIGPQKWKNDSLSTIRLSRGYIKKSDQGCNFGRASDPLPHVREVLAELSNHEANKYAKEVRIVLAKLRQLFLVTNEEIKAILNVRYSFEKQLENVRKDMKLNQESQMMRAARPDSEKQSDGVDDLLRAESMHLKNIKQELESNLSHILYQLNALDESRKRLQAVINERTRVTDLICNGVPPPTARSMSSLNFGSMTSRDLNSGCGPRSLVSSQVSMPTTPLQSDPLSAFTPECEAAIKMAENCCQSSEQLRGQMKGVIDKVKRMQELAHKSVNDGIIQKVAETAALKQHLLLAKVDTRAASSRAQRWLQITEKNFLNVQGPEEVRFLAQRERLDRPIIRVFQRHPGSQVPEAQEIIKSGDFLRESMIVTNKNLQMLRSVDNKLEEDITKKSKAMNVDLLALRNRRYKADHRWSLNNST